MRVKALVGMMTMAAVLPLAARAESQLKPDLWVGANDRLAYFARSEGELAAPEAASAALQSVLQAPRMIAAVDTQIRRVGEADRASLAGRGATLFAPRFVSATLPGPMRVEAPLLATASAATVTSVPEMSTGFAASALTLLLGGIAVLRGQRNRTRT